MQLVIASLKVETDKKSRPFLGILMETTKKTTMETTEKIYALSFRLESFKETKFINDYDANKDGMRRNSYGRE